MSNASSLTLAEPKLTAEKARCIGWKILAGGMDPTEAADIKIASGILSHMERTGGKAALVLAADGIHYEIWRPLSEMETVCQTEQRLYKWKLDRRVKN